MIKKPILSIILPVYNTEQYLSRSIDSLLTQSFTDFEIILVNNGSTDQSCTICRSYVDASNGRIQMLDLPKANVSAARNAGMDKAKGRYIILEKLIPKLLIRFGITDLKYIQELYDEIVLQTFYSMSLNINKTNYQLILHAIASRKELFCFAKHRSRSLLTKNVLRLL